MAKLNDIHINIVILNNDGGGIFFYLPQKAAEHILNVYLAPTGLNFEYTAMLYDFSFKRLNNITDFSQVSFSNMNSYI